MQVVQQQQPSISLSEEFTITCEEKKYKTSLQTVDYRIRISIMMEEFSQYKWSEFYSVEQLYKINKFFRNCDDLQEAFHSLANIFKSEDFTIKITEDKMNISFSLQSKYQNFSFDIQLVQGEINVSEAIVSLNQEILDLKKQAKQFQKTLEDKDQQIEELKLYINELLEKRFKAFEIDLKPKPKKLFGNILYEEEVEQISWWINQGARKINLQLIYQATRDGFDIAKLYEKCANKTPVILVVNTTFNKRFGAFTDREVKNYNSYQVCNPNNCFLFSLDLKKKFTSNEQNCQYALYSDANCFRFGNSNDFQIYSNSSTNNYSYNQYGTYGKNEGITQNGMLAGQSQFMTIEVEAFQVIYQ